MSKEAMKLALEALENAQANVGEWWPEAIAAIREALAEQPAQQEPPTVAELVCVCGAEWEWRNRDWELVATPPAQRTWVGLTEEEILELNFDGEYCIITDDDEEILEFARSIEATLRSKNT